MEPHITIKDVARKAKVGIATVSRVLNDAQRVDPATRQRVREVILRLGYRPNATGRRLVKKSTEMVCFLLSNREFMNPFHSGVLYGVERYLSGTGHDVVFTNLHYDPSAESGSLALPRILTHRGIADGFIVSGTNYPNLLAAMDKLGVPYVLFGNNFVDNKPGDSPNTASERRLDSVYYDDGEAERQMVERLIAMGHRHIWFVGDIEMPWFLRRVRVYREAMRGHGLAPQEFSLSGADQRDYADYGEQAVAGILASGEPVTAVMGGNDGIAYGAWRSLRRAGLRVPDDVSVVGFDDVQEASWTDPPLTTVRVPTHEVGVACAQMLLQKLKEGGAAQPPVVLAAQLIERGSWSAPRVPAMILDSASVLGDT
jgi:DNA-binding LacI/PurR family transcriptional regulator